MSISLGDHEERIKILEQEFKNNLTGALRRIEELERKQEILEEAVKENSKKLWGTS